MQLLLDFFESGWTPSAPATLIDATVKGACILLLAFAAAALLNRFSAATRSFAWTLALVGLCALPALTLLLPTHNIPVLPDFLAAPLATTVDMSQTAEPFRVEVQPEQILAADASPRALDGSLARVPSISRRWSQAIVIAWATAALVVLLRFAAGLIGLWRKSRFAAPVADHDWMQLVAELAARYGIRRRVSLRLGGGGTIPQTWGFSKPVILLPVEALEWPQERVRAVLLHELAHIARGDFLSQNAARVACALHWFNPLVWFAARQLRSESEQASDDLVLSAGLAPTSYASQLVDVLMAARAADNVPLAAVAMARRSDLERRVRAILDGGRSRVGLSLRTIAIAIVAALCFVVPCGIFRLQAIAHDAPKLERLPDGMTIEIIAISKHPSGQATWWGPDGKPLEEAPCDPPEGVPKPMGQNVREIAARITGLPKDAALAWHPTQSSSHGASPPRKNGKALPDVQVTVAEFEPGMVTCVVHFDLSLGDWRVEHRCEGKMSMGISAGERAYFFGKARATTTGTSIAIAHNIVDRDARVVAIGNEGKQLLPISSTSGAAGHIKGIDVEFSVPPSQIREFQVQSRAVGRYEIKDVALQPSTAVR
jgi:beta-lactamase regulating signal transducer with metallopeptidase domain